MTTPSPSTTFQTILTDLIIAAQLAEALPVAAGPAALAAKLLEILQAAITAHQSVTGQPLDPSILHSLPLLPVPPPNPPTGT